MSPSWDYRCPGPLCAGKVSALPLAAATSGKAPSGGLPSGFQQVTGCKLEQTIGRKIGSVNQLSKIFNTSFAPHGLICTNLLLLQKEPNLQWAPEGPLNAFLTVGRRGCSSGSGVHLSHLAWFPVCQATQALEARCLGRKVEAALLKVGVQPSWQLGGFTGSRCSSW